MSSCIHEHLTRLHLACGNVFLSGWVNIDYDVRAPGIIRCDLTKGIPFKDESVDEILASHFLEHLKLRHEAIPFLQECHRVLRPGGIMSFITPNFEILHGAHISKGIGAVASATYGNGRTEWDYHVSAWWPDRFKHLAEEGHIHTLAGSYRVWDGVEIVRIITLWRPHSPYEVTAIFRKLGGIVMTYPTWLDSPEIIGEGFLKPSQWRWKNLIESRSKLMRATRVIKRLPILGRLLRAARDRMLKPRRVGIQDPQWGV